MIKSRSIIVACLLLFCVSGNAQTENLYDFDQKKWHFGFALSYNQSDFYLYRSNTTSFPQDSLQSLYVAARPGFTLGVISSINFSPNFKIRFAIPSLSRRGILNILTLNFPILVSFGQNL